MPTSTATEPSDESLKSRQAPLFESYVEVLLHAVHGASKSFVLAFGLRGGVSFLLNALRRGRKGLSVGVLLEPHVRRFANMIGSFSLLWKLLFNGLQLHWRRLDAERKFFGAPEPQNQLQGKDLQRISAFMAGCVAGLSVLFESYENRVAAMQQVGVRALQSMYNGLKARNIFSFYHGDTVLFSIACASIMYAYVMQPGTIPKEYNNWMIKTAKVSKEALEMARRNNRRLESLVFSLPSSKSPAAISSQEIYHCINKHGGSNAVRALQSTASFLDANWNESSQTLPVVPCSIIHPTVDTCTGYNLWITFKVWKSIAPVYAALNFVPMAVLRYQKLVDNPISMIRNGLYNTAVSSSFLAAYVGLYMIGVCGIRHAVSASILQQDWKGFYYLFGAVASGVAILLEKKQRRAELAMYCLPKGMQSLFLVMQRRRLVCHIPGSETALTCLSFGILMSFYQLEPDSVSPLLVKILDRVVGRY